MREQQHTGEASGSPSLPSFESYAGSAAENYERFFVPRVGAPLADDLIETAALRPGERVLDVACGTGVVARLAVQRVGPTGTVAALDISDHMLAVARAVTPSSMAVHWYESSAEDMALPDGSYDAVLCQMGLQFCSDRLASLREIRRVLAPAGRLVTNLPGPTPGLFIALREALREHVSPQAAAFVDVIFSLHDHRAIHELFDDAGFEDVAVHSTTKELRLPAPVDFLWQYVWSTPLAGVLSQVDSEGRAAVERDVVVEWETSMRDGALWMSVDVATVTARKS